MNIPAREEKGGQPGHETREGSCTERAALKVTFWAWHLPRTWEPVYAQPASTGRQSVHTKTKGLSWHPEQQEACGLPYLEGLEGRGEREERGRWGCRSSKVERGGQRGSKARGGKRNWPSFPRKPHEWLRCPTPRPQLPRCSPGEVLRFPFQALDSPNSLS